MIRFSVKAATAAVVVALMVGGMHAASVAGDISETKIYGFSADGRYFAFEIYGIQDGSGMPYCEFYILDVPANDFAVRPVKIRTDEIDGDAASLSNLRDKVRAQVAGSLEKFGIGGEMHGVQLVHHPMTDLTTDGTYAKFTTRHLAYLPSEQSEYEVHLDTFTTGDKCFYTEARIFTLRLKHLGKEKILQRDRRLPRSRGCVYQYRISRVLCHNNMVVVILDTFRPGFEGPDIRQMAVSGSLEF